MDWDVESRRHTPQGELRRTLRLEEAIDNAERTGRCAVFDGPGVNDLLVTAAGEARRILPYLAGWSAERNLVTVVYSLGGGLRVIQRGDHTVRLPSEFDHVNEQPATRVLARLLAFIKSQRQHVLLVIDYVEGLVPDGSATDSAQLIEQLAELATNRSWLDAHHRLMLIHRGGRTDQRLVEQTGFITVTIGLPDGTERVVFLSQMAHSPVHPLHLEEQLDRGRAAHLSGGLSLDDLKRLRDNASVTRPISVERIVEAKSAALRRLGGHVLEVVPERLTLDHDVAGLPQLSLLVAEAGVGAGATLRIILAGPPGNGKTWVFPALATALGVPAVRLAQIRASHHGEDELGHALAAVTALAPCALLIDGCEDAGLGRHSEDGAEAPDTAHVRATLLSWLGDIGQHNGVTVVGTTNHPDRLDPAFVNRFHVVPVLHPTADEAAEIMRIQATRDGLYLDVEGAAAELRQAGATISGRTAVGLVERAGAYAARHGRRELIGADIRDALNDLMVPASASDELLALVAIAYTTWRPHLPWQASRRLGRPGQIPSYVEPLLDGHGELDATRLRQRIDELSAIEQSKPD